MRRRLFMGAVNLSGHRGVQGVIHQCGLARTGHPGHASEQTHGKFHGDVLQVVATRTHHGQRLASRVFLQVG